MTAALTIAVLLALSVSVVRVADVAMRLTGLPEAVARFQCLSALTGTGFTTHESEMIVNYPIRRRILVSLMIFGNLGVVSVSATFIVAFVGAGANQQAILMQALAFAVAIGVVVAMTTFRPLDRAMCGLVAVILAKLTSLGNQRYQRILQLDDGYSVSEHTVVGSCDCNIGDLLAIGADLNVLAIRRGKSRDFKRVEKDDHLSSGDILICFGSDAAHEALENTLMQTASESAKG